MADYNKWETDVADMERVTDSVVALVQKFKSDLEATKNPSGSGYDTAKVDALMARWDASADRLAAMVAENTPAADEVEDTGEAKPEGEGSSGVEFPSP